MSAPRVWVWSAGSRNTTAAFGGYTSRRLPIELVWSQHFLDIIDAIAVERQIKGWSRAKKEALIRGDYSTIKTLAKRGR